MILNGRRGKLFDIFRTIAVESPERTNSLTPILKKCLFLSFVLYQPKESIWDY